MPQIHVTDRNGTEHSIEAKEGWRVMEIIREAGLPIEAACGGSCACATCHVYLNDGWFAKVPSAEEEEVDMLDLAMDPEDNSRLSCQVKFDASMDGMKLTLAPE